MKAYLCIACPIFMLFLYWLSELQRLKFIQLPCIFAHLCILLRTYARRVGAASTSIDVTYASAGDSTRLTPRLTVWTHEQQQLRMSERKRKLDIHGSGTDLRKKMRY